MITADQRRMLVYWYATYGESFSYTLMKHTKDRVRRCVDALKAAALLVREGDNYRITPSGVAIVQPYVIPLHREQGANPLGSGEGKRVALSAAEARLKRAEADWRRFQAKQAKEFEALSAACRR